MKRINVLYIPKEDKIYVWDKELLDAATAYDRGVALANEFLANAIPNHCYWLGNKFIHIETCDCDWQEDLRREELDRESF